MAEKMKELNEMLAEMNVVMLSVEHVIPYANNPRNNDGAVDAVMNSIAEYGFKKPILVDREHVIVAGHTRLMAARRLGLKEVPCVVMTDLDDARIKAFRLADNRTSEFSDWDNDLLKEEMKKAADFDFSAFGFDTEDVGKQIQEEIGVKTHKCPKCGCEWTARDI